MTLPAIVEFEGVEIRIVDRSGRPWITQDDLARALYGIKGGDTSVTPLSGAIRSVRRLLDKNKDEFTTEMTAILTMETAGGPQQVRIYSARGAYLMGMLAKTESGKRFRQWVLDVLEGKASMNGRLGFDLSKEALPAMRARTAAMNAISRSLEVIVRSAGRRPAALAAPDLYRAIGVRIDLTGSDAFAQTELPLPESYATTSNPAALAALARRKHERAREQARITDRLSEKVKLAIADGHAASPEAGIDYVLKQTDSDTSAMCERLAFLELEAEAERLLNKEVLAGTSVWDIDENGNPVCRRIAPAAA